MAKIRFGQKEQRPETLSCARPFIVGYGICSVPRAADRVSGRVSFTKQVGCICTVSTASAADIMHCHQTVPETIGKCSFISHLLLARMSAVISFEWTLTMRKHSSTKTIRLLQSSSVVQEFTDSRGGIS